MSIKMLNDPCKAAEEENYFNYNQPKDRLKKKIKKNISKN